MSGVSNFSNLSNMGKNPLGNANSVFGELNLSNVDTGLDMSALSNLGELDLKKLMSGITGQNSNGMYQNGLGGQVATGGADSGGGLFTSDNMQLAGLGINAFNGLLGAYTGLSSLGLAKDQFKHNKGISDTNLSNSANLTNERLATRQATRMKSDGITDQAAIDAGVKEYMAKYGVSGKAGG